MACIRRRFAPSSLRSNGRSKPLPYKVSQRDTLPLTSSLLPLTREQSEPFIRPLADALTVLLSAKHIVCPSGQHHCIAHHFSQSENIIMPQAYFITTIGSLLSVTDLHPHPCKATAGASPCPTRCRNATPYFFTLHYYLLPQKIASFDFSNEALFFV